MRSQLPKVLHKIAGKSMVSHVLSSVAKLNPAQIITVVAPEMQQVMAVCSAEEKSCRFVVQKQQKGTADAVRCAVSELGKVEYVLVLCGDTPLIRTETLRHLLKKSATEDADIAVLGMRLDNPSGYGRMITDKNNNLEAIVECKDASVQNKKIKLCNSGIMLIRAKYIAELLGKLSTDNSANEYYLTDIIAIANHKKLRVIAVEADDVSELSGINNRAQLAAAEEIFQQRLRLQAMEKGVTMINPQTVFLSADTSFGEDVVIHPFVVFLSGVSVGNNVEIRSYSHIDNAIIENGAIIGPFARIRPGSHIEENAHVGNFVEIKASRLGKGAKANHLSYIGDSDVGENANIGAGTITCNYDGTNKYKTTIGNGAFIGSNSSLVAPVAIGSGAVIGAGSVITADVDADALAIARARQIAKPGRAKTKNQKK